MKIIRIMVWVTLMLILTVSHSQAGWLIYHEPELKGTILDIDTKQPLEGAVVVAVYSKRTIGLGAGTIDSVINVRETLTDKKGNFTIPSYTTLIQPFSWQIPNGIIIFKPGYASLELGTSFFTGEQTREQEGSWYWSKDLKFRVRGSGIVELPKVRTTDERRHASIVGVSGYSEKDLPLLYKARDNSLGIINGGNAK